MAKSSVRQNSDFQLQDPSNSPVRRSIKKVLPAG